MLPPIFECMPEELKGLPRWVTWAGAKVPFDPKTLRGKASVTDPSTWAAFEQAQTAYEEGDRDGVGFVLDGDGLVGVDLDKVVTDGQPDPAAIALLDRIGCRYIELSPSGSGLRGFGRGPNIGGRRGLLDGVRCELYSDKRYLTVTGQVLRDGPLLALPGFADAVHALAGNTPTEDNGRVQRIAEENSSHLLCSSVGIPLSTLPTSEGERNKKLFELARWVRGTQPNATQQELRVLAQEWHRLALPVIGTKDFATTWADFLRGLEKVKYPYGATLTAIVEGIDFEAPLPLELESLGYGSAGGRLIRICQALQAHEGEKPFFISARQAGELAGIHFTDASKVLAALVADDVLQLVSRGSGKVASRYRMRRNQG